MISSRALGITASLPEEDRHAYRKEWMEGQLAMLFGGRVAEEIIFGPGAVTTGAGNDIEQATDMARRMVTAFGMSKVIGLVAIGEAEHEIFLGRDISQRRTVSEHTSRLVDQEVKRILDEAHERAREVLEANKALLESFAQALLERETLDRKAIQTLERGEQLPPLELPEPESLAPVAAESPPVPDRSAPPLGLPGADGPLPGPAPSVYAGDEGEPLT
jgi:cell division protease FtsH